MRSETLKSAPGSIVVGKSPSSPQAVSKVRPANASARLRVAARNGTATTTPTLTRLHAFSESDLTLRASLHRFRPCGSADGLGARGARESHLNNQVVKLVLEL